MSATDDRRWLEMAARIAGPFLGTTGAAPTVGVAIVRPAERVLVGRAVTPRGGDGDAVRLTLDEAGEAARGATLYATLAPTGDATTAAIAASGITRLVAGVAEPDHQMADAAARRLHEAGVALVITDNAECRRLHAGYLSRATRKRPFVTARLAVSADSMVAGNGRSAFDLFGEAAGRWNEMQRALADAVLVGWGTASADDALLEVDLPGLEDRTPLRLVVAGQKTHAPRMRLLARAPEHPVAVIAIPEKKLELPEGIGIIAVPGFKGRPDPLRALEALASRGVQNLFIETGPTLLAAFLAAGAIDRFHLLRSETVVGQGGIPATPRGTIEARLAAGGFSLVDHRLLDADNLRTFERSA